MIGRFLRLMILAATGAACLGAAPAIAAYPERTVTFYVGFAAGGGTDLLARIIAKHLSDKWGQPVVVNNMPGADGTISDNVVAHAAPDGYSIGMVTINHTVTPSTEKLNYDAVKDFTPVTQLASSPEFLVVSTAMHIDSVKDLIALAKSKPGQLNFFSTGPGSAPFLESELLMQKAGISMVNVTYRGAGPGTTALLGGEIQVMFTTATSALELMNAGKLKALGVTSRVRSPALPDVPTIAEAAGLPDYEAGNWFGVVGPAGMPAAVVEKLNHDMAEIMHAPDVQQQLINQGFVPMATSSQEFGQFLAADVAKWANLLKTINVK